MIPIGKKKLKQIINVAKTNNESVLLIMLVLTWRQTYCHGMLFTPVDALDLSGKCLELK